MPVQEAKEFIYHELQEVTVQAVGRCLRWVEESEQLILEVSPRPSGLPTVQATLEPGLQEVVATEPIQEGGVPFPTLALQFARAQGWDREKAERWVGERLRFRDRGRTTLLSTPHRAMPGLARCLGEVLFPGAGWLRPADFIPPAWVKTLGDSAVKFVAVPPLNPGGGSEHDSPEADSPGHLSLACASGFQNGGTLQAPALGLAAARGTRPARGAGLEIDLADGRSVIAGPGRPGLPAELRAALPACGLVNYPEAVAVVRALEELVSDPCFQTACSAQGRTVGSPLAGASGLLPVAVMALFPAQAELIRRLSERSPVLARARDQFEVGPVAAFLHRECLIGLVSLTRSHTHRAVPFCDHPRMLVSALTRAMVHLVVFGDVGTVLRRMQWQGALDHLDEGSARREQAVLTHLVGHLSERLPDPDLSTRSHLRESSRV
jgi:hypothetical protein